MTIIKLANRSRSNRNFYDSLIRVIAVEINIGSTSLNRDMELWSYRPVYDMTAEDFGSNVEKRGWDTPRQMLPAKTLDAIDAMLVEAAQQGLEGCCDKPRIMAFIKEHTDLTDCHLTALNELVLSQWHRRCREGYV